MSRRVLHHVLRLTAWFKKERHLTSSWVSERKCELTPMMKGVGVLSTSNSFPGKMGTYVKLERGERKTWRRLRWWFKLETNGNNKWKNRTLSPKICFLTRNNKGDVISFVAIFFYWYYFFHSNTFIFCIFILKVDNNTKQQHCNCCCFYYSNNGK